MEKSRDTAAVVTRHRMNISKIRYTTQKTKIINNSQNQRVNPCAREG